MGSILFQMNYHLIYHWLLNTAVSGWLFSVTTRGRDELSNAEGFRAAAGAHSIYLKEKTVMVQQVMIPFLQQLNTNHVSSAGCLKIFGVILNLMLENFTFTVTNVAAQRFGPNFHSKSHFLVFDFYFNMNIFSFRCRGGMSHMANIRDGAICFSPDIILLQCLGCWSDLMMSGIWHHITHS